MTLSPLLSSIIPISKVSSPEVLSPLQPRAIDRETVVNAVGALISQPNYPCIAALKSFYKKDFEIGIYEELGSGQSWPQLRQDLLKFVELQKNLSRSI